MKWPKTPAARFAATSVTGLAAFIVGLTLLSSCGDKAPPVAAPQVSQAPAYALPVAQPQLQAPQMVQPPAAPAQVVVVQQPAQVAAGGLGGDGLVTGMLLGHMLSGAGRSSAAAAAPGPVTNNTTVVNKTYVTPRPAAVVPRPAAVTPRYMPSSSSYSASRAAHR